MSAIGFAQTVLQSPAGIQAPQDLCRIDEKQDGAFSQEQQFFPFRKRCMLCQDQADMAVVAAASAAPEVEVLAAAPEVLVPAVPEVEGSAAAPEEARGRAESVAPEVRIPAVLEAHAPAARIPVLLEGHAPADPEGHGRAESSADFIVAITGLPWGLPHRGALTAAAISVVRLIYSSYLP